METTAAILTTITLAALPTRWGTQWNGNEYLSKQLKTLIQTQLPTRWGTQWNGNQEGIRFARSWPESPHSLGNSMEWKLRTLSLRSNTMTRSSPLAGELNGMETT